MKAQQTTTESNNIFEQLTEAEMQRVIDFAAGMLAEKELHRERI